MSNSEPDRAEFGGVVKRLRKPIGYVCAAVVLGFFGTSVVVTHSTALFAWPYSDPEAVNAVQDLLILMYSFFGFVTVCMGAIWGLSNGGKTS